MRELTMVIREGINGIGLEVEIEKKSTDKPHETKTVELTIRDGQDYLASFSIDPDDLPAYADFFTRAAAEHQKVQEFFK